MDSSITLRQCSQCRTTIGTDSCPGCRVDFCPKHLIEHETQSTEVFRKQKLIHTALLKKFLDKMEKNQSTRKDILSRIDQWEKKIIERIRYKAELARQRLDCLAVKSDQEIIKDAQVLREDMRKEKNDFIEKDIQRLTQSMVRMRSELDRLTSSGGVELYTEPHHMIDWNHLIVVREKSNKMVSAVVDEQTENDDTDDQSSPNEQRRSSPSFSLPDDADNSKGKDSDDDFHLFERQPTQDTIASSAKATASIQPISSTLSNHPPPRIGWGMGRGRGRGMPKRPPPIIQATVPSSATEPSPPSSEIDSMGKTTTPPTSDETKQRHDSFDWISQFMRQRRDNPET